MAMIGTVRIATAIGYSVRSVGLLWTNSTASRIATPLPAINPPIDSINVAPVHPSSTYRRSLTWVPRRGEVSSGLHRLVEKGTPQRAGVPRKLDRVFDGRVA